MKSLILTLTVNPCLDKSFWVDGIEPDKKHRARDVRIDPGGGGINVARVLKRLGAEVLAIFPSGGETGDLLKRQLNLEGVPFQAVSTEGDTRINVTAIDSLTDAIYLFSMPGPRITRDETSSLRRTLESYLERASLLIISGSLSPDVTTSFYKETIELARTKNVKTILDASGEALRVGASASPFLIKANKSELTTIFVPDGKNTPTEEELFEAAGNLIDRGVTAVLISLGEEGAYLITGNRILKAIAPTVKAVSKIGAGDSMVAGVALKVLRNADWGEIVGFGVACGTSAVLTPGTELARHEDILRILPEVRVEEIT